MALRRTIEPNTKVYVGYPVPADGFTLKVEVEEGKIAICGSNFLERPDCSYSPTYNWKFEVTDYTDIFLNENGLPQTNRLDKRSAAQTEVTVYVTIEGLALDGNITFLLNTTLGDTTIRTGIILLLL